MTRYRNSSRRGYSSGRAEQNAAFREGEIVGEEAVGGEGGFGGEGGLEGEGGGGMYRREGEGRFIRSSAARYDRFRRREERQIEIITLGLVMLVFMIPLVFPNTNLDGTDGMTPVVLMLGGIILLAGAFFQVQRRFFVNPLTWLGGAAMLAFGFYEFQSRSEPLGPLLPILLFGGVILGSLFTGQF